MSDDDAIRCIRQYAAVRPFPIDWTDTQIGKRLRDAEKTCNRGKASESDDANGDRSRKPKFTPQIRPVGELLNDFPVLRDPIIDGLLRVGETMNVIAPPKLGKSWLVLDLAMAVATGRDWLDAYPTHRGNVLLLDNELHAETSSDRIPRVAWARGISIESLNQSMFVDNLRGRLPDINALHHYFATCKPGFFKLIILDAFYRFMPKDTDENSNGNVTDLYNVLDRYAADLQCSFVLVHHASKGNQSAKSITDVGAGAGSQSRATDTHLVLRHHQEPGCVVVDAAMRSWPPIEPRCLRWSFPVWHTDDSLEAKDLKFENRGKARSSEGKADRKKPTKEEWTAEMFAERFVCEEPQRMTTIRSRAGDAMGSQRKAKELQEEAVDLGLIYLWKSGANQPVRLATIEQPDPDAF